MSTIVTSHARRLVTVWPLALRVFHWALVAAVAEAWLEAEGSRHLHELAGYTAAGLILLRLYLGFFGSRYSRFSQFVKGPRMTASYVNDIAHRRERRYLGHNPAGAAMVVTLIVTVIGVAATGYMQTTNAFWGVEWVSETHEFLGNAIPFLVLLHVGGVILASIRHRENLVLSMVDGLKRAPSGDDAS